MTGTISFGGIGSGMDTEGIVTGLVNASKGPIEQLQKRASALDAAVASLSEVSSLVANLKKSVTALSDPNEVASYKGESDDDSVAVSVNGAALPGVFQVEVEQLARAHRAYSDAFASATDALGMSGNMSFTMGSGETFEIEVGTDDSLNSIVSSINAQTNAAAASVFYDGAQYRLQVRSMDTGDANSIAVSGTTLGLENNVVQEARDARAYIDGYLVTSSTNQIAGAMQGVTMGLRAENTGPVTITVASDPDAMKSKVQDMVTAFNNVMKKIHVAAGFGENEGTVTELRGDSALRAVTSRMSEALVTRVGGGRYQSLASIGVKLNNDGTLQFDSTKFNKALEDDPAAVKEVMAGPEGQDGAMDVMQDLATALTAPDGLLTTRKQMLESRGRTIDERIDTEQKRLDRYAESLRKQFVSMDTTVAGNYAELDYLTRLYSG
jgi:flagellar hook-associated protein 2